MERLAAHTTPRRSRARPADHEGAFLAWVLRRYGEIISVRSRPNERAIEFAFLVDGTLGCAEFMRLRSQLSQSVDAVSRFAEPPHGDGRLRVRRIEVEGYTELIVQRDLGTLTISELEVMVGLMRQSLGARLLTEAVDDGRDRTGRDEPAGILDHLLEDLRQSAASSTLIGLRQSGQPLVYNAVSARGAAARSRHR